MNLLCIIITTVLLYFVKNPEGSICEKNQKSGNTYTKAKPRRFYSLTGANNQAKYYCSEFGYKSDDDDSTDCYDAAKIYFNEVKEPNESVVSYTRFCKLKDINANKASYIINHLSNYKWDMITATHFLEKIDERYLTKFDKYKYLCITVDEWYETEFKNFNLYDCLDDFTPSAVDDQMNESAVCFAKKYINWLSASDRKNETVSCGCKNAIGIGRIFETKILKNKIFTETLFDYYDSICYDQSLKNNLWLRDQYLHIRENASEFNVKELLQFLKNLLPITEAGWQSSDQNTKWPISYIAKFVDHPLQTVLPEYNSMKLNMIALVINSGFSPFYFANFLRIVSEHKEAFEINQEDDLTNCQNEILRTSFHGIDKISQESEKKIKKLENIEDNCYWDKSIKLLFTCHLIMLLEIFELNSSSEPKNCTTFANSLNLITNLFYESNLTEQEFKISLTLYKESGYSLPKIAKELKDRFIREDNQNSENNDSNT